MIRLTRFMRLQGRRGRVSYNFVDSDFGRNLRLRGRTLRSLRVRRLLEF